MCRVTQTQVWHYNVVSTPITKLACSFVGRRERFVTVWHLSVHKTFTLWSAFYHRSAVAYFAYTGGPYASSRVPAIYTAAFVSSRCRRRPPARGSTHILTFHVCSVMWHWVLWFHNCRCTRVVSVKSNFCKKDW